MQRSRLKNIINKSKTISNKQEVGNPFDEFKKSLPLEIDDNYRLEAAWKAYGSPKDYKTALWYGMIQPIDENNVKLPSIGYNEETDEYEYLNKGRENETVAKDIRVWDNDVIPFVQELKQGGFIRVYNEEKDCWTYSKNSQPKTEVEESEINSFKNGGKPEKKHWKKPDDWNEDKIPYEEWIADINPEYLGENYDLKTAYENFPKEMLERWKWAVNSDDPEYYMNYQDKDGKYIYHLGSIAPIENGNYVFLKKGREENNPELHYETDAYWSGENGLRDTHNLVFSGDRYYYIKRVPDYKGKPKLDSKEAGEDPIGYLNDGTPLYKKGDGTIGPLTKENIGKDNLFDLIKNSNANFAKRLQDPNRKYITYPDGSIGNFKLAWSEDETGTIVYPEIQEINGQLVDLSGDPEKAWKSAIEHKDYVYFPSNDAADWFTKNYKNYYKGFYKTPQAFKQGGQMNVIPEGALHARKNNMEGAGKDFTAKGIPVVDNDGEQQAEIEKEEWTMTKELTEDVEKWYKKFYDEETSQKDKDELAIKCGKRITEELLHNTDDRANLITKMLEEEE